MFKIVCLWLSIEKTLAYYEMWPYAVNYKSVMFNSTCPGPSDISCSLVNNNSADIKLRLIYTIFGWHNFWSTQYLVNTIFGWHNIWSTQYLVNTIFGQHNIWSTNYLVNTIFGWHNIWSIQYLVKTMFGQHSIWSTQYLVDAAIDRQNGGSTKWCLIKRHGAILIVPPF